MAPHKLGLGQDVIVVRRTPFVRFPAPSSVKCYYTFQNRLFSIIIEHDQSIATSSLALGLVVHALNIVHIATSQ